MADDFAALAESIRRVYPDSRFEPLTEQQLDVIRREHPDVPDHYLEFLRRIGWGGLGSNFMLYSSPCAPDDIYDAGTAAELSGILLIGDDFSGWVLGFDTQNGWRFVGVDGSSLETYSGEERTLAAFMARRIADSEAD